MREFIPFPKVKSNNSATEVRNLTSRLFSSTSGIKPTAIPPSSVFTIHILSTNKYIKQLEKEVWFCQNTCSMYSSHKGKATKENTKFQYKF